MITMTKHKLTVIDFFSGAGGFSEGFRQQGFYIIKGIDSWEPAVKTHNLNHGLNDSPQNVLDFVGENSRDVSAIESLPDADVIVGSPSCVTFSMSNRSGKADKTEGLKLIEAYLRVVAVKKHKSKNPLKAWLMENVPNSGNYVKEKYAFIDLNLKDWAKDNNIDPKSVALSLNGVVLNASDYGAPQNRNRFICGEIISTGEFPLPEKSAQHPPTLQQIKSRMPKPNKTNSSGIYQDPNFPGLKLKARDISDHFYDTGIYITEWESARNLKTMHPFMGKMSFPENEQKTSRTITATRSVSTREAIIYKSEYNRVGHGEYRTPTIREAASLMGFPYTYQFIGSERIKWKLIGNSVSPQLSNALAKTIRIRLGHPPVLVSRVDFSHQLNLDKGIDNLNSFKPNTFDQKRIRKPEARFRRALFKGQNMTIDLLNYFPGGKEKNGVQWCAFAFYGTGSNHKQNHIDGHKFGLIRDILKNNFSSFEELNNDLSDIFSQPLSPSLLQDFYEQDIDLKEDLNPLVIANRLSQVLDKYCHSDLSGPFAVKNMVRPEFTCSQIIAMYALACLVDKLDQVESISVTENKDILFTDLNLQLEASGL